MTVIIENFVSIQMYAPKFHRFVLKTPAIRIDQWLKHILSWQMTGPYCKEKPKRKCKKIENFCYGKKQLIQPFSCFGQFISNFNLNRAKHLKRLDYKPNMGQSERFKYRRCNLSAPMLIINWISCAFAQRFKV